ncbi:MAG: hypothetical protein WAZ21_00635 [Candidatus Saccharimonadales bacterium]
MPVPREPISSFESTWSIEVAKGGFLQLPHDFYRNTRKLGLSTTDALIAIYIMGYETGSFIAASSVAKTYGVSIGTVRKSFRRLDELNLIHRHFQKGEANRFSYSGLKQRVKEYAKLRESTQQIMRIGVSRSASNPVPNQDTNKEPERTNNKDLDGKEKYRLRREELGL